MSIAIKPTSVRLEPKLLKSLDALSKKLNRSKSWLISESIKYYLEERADLEIALEKFTDPKIQYEDWESVRDDLLNKD